VNVPATIKNRGPIRLRDPTTERTVISRNIIIDKIPSQSNSHTNFLKARETNGNKEYLVKWVGYSDDDDFTWESLYRMNDVFVRPVGTVETMIFFSALMFALIFVSTL